IQSIKTPGAAPSSPVDRLRVRNRLLVRGGVAEMELKLVLEDCQDVLRVLDAEAASLFAMQTEGLDDAVGGAYAFGNAATAAADNFGFSKGFTETNVHSRLLQTF